MGLGDVRMDDAISRSGGVAEPADMEAAIQHYLTETDRSLTRMQRDQTDIEKLKAETRELLAETQAMLAALRKSM